MVNKKIIFLSALFSSMSLIVNTQAMKPSRTTIKKTIVNGIYKRPKSLIVENNLTKKTVMTNESTQADIPKTNKHSKNIKKLVKPLKLDNKKIENTKNLEKQFNLLKANTNTTRTINNLKTFKPNIQKLKNLQNSPSKTKKKFQKEILELNNCIKKQEFYKNNQPIKRIKRINEEIYIPSKNDNEINNENSKYDDIGTISKIYEDYSSDSLDTSLLSNKFFGVGDDLIAQLKSQIRDLKEENQKLKEENINQKIEIENLKKEKEKKQIKQVLNIHNENFELLNKNDKKIREQKEEHKESIKESDELKTYKENIEIRNQLFDENKRDRNRLTEMNDTLKKETEENKAMMRKLEEEYNNLNTIYNEKEIELKKLEEEMQNNEKLKKINQYKDQINEKQQCIDKYKNKIYEKQQRINKYKIEADALTRELKELEEKKRETEIELANISEINTKLKNKLSEEYDEAVRSYTYSGDKVYHSKKNYQKKMKIDELKEQIDENNQNIENIRKHKNEKQPLLDNYNEKVNDDIEFNKRIDKLFERLVKVARELG